MKTYILGCLLLLFTLAGCAQWGLSEDKKTSLRQTYAGMLAEGKITAEQYQALLTALEAGKLDSNLLETIIGSILSVGLSLLGVRVWRGGIETRKGSSPTISA